VDVLAVVTLAALVLALVAGWTWYRRSLRALEPDEGRSLSAVRLTAEALHRHDRAPWRVVYEIGGALGDVDHVVVGPPGIIAITTVLGDRPARPEVSDAATEARLVAEAAVTRGPVDEVARPAGVPCQRWARVYWGRPDPSRPAHEEVVRGSEVVEGQRIAAWLDALAAGATEPLAASSVESAWRTVVMGIGRPDPRAEHR
jgi:hypothetical protein